jgi:hypothetical protein
MKTNEIVGYKQMVKQGKLTARDAFNALVSEASKGGQIGLAVFRSSKAAKWLCRRIRFSR